MAYPDLYSTDDCYIACNLYKTSVESTRLYVGPNVETPGTNLDITPIASVCEETGKGIATTSSFLDKCAACFKASSDTLITGEANIELLFSWQYTCHTYDQKGAKAAANCWKGLPDDISACVTGDEAIDGPPSKTSFGSASATLPSGATASSSDLAGSLPSSTSTSASPNAAFVNSPHKWNSFLAGLLLVSVIALVL